MHISYQNKVSLYKTIKSQVKIKRLIRINTPKNNKYVVHNLANKSKNLIVI